MSGASVDLLEGEQIVQEESPDILDGIGANPKLALLTLGIWAWWYANNSVSVITDQRVIVKEKGFISSNTREFTFSEIERMDTTSGLFEKSGLEIQTSAGGVVMPFSTPTQARNTIREQQA